MDFPSNHTNPPDCDLAVMERSSSPSHSSHPCDPPSKAKKTEALPQQSDEQRESETPTVSFIGSNWPSLPIPDETDSPIQPGQKEKPPSPVPWKVQTKDPEDREKDRMGKYAQYFKGNEILPIPEIIEKLEPIILSLVVLDLKTRRLVGLKTENRTRLCNNNNIYFKSVFKNGTHIHPYRRMVVIIIITIIMSCHQHGYPWPSLATFPYRSSPLAGLLGYIPYPHTAAVCMF